MTTLGGVSPLRLRSSSLTRFAATLLPWLEGSARRDDVSLDYDLGSPGEYREYRVSPDVPSDTVLP